MKKLTLFFAALTVVFLMVPMVAAATTPTSVPGRYRGFTHGIVLSVDGDAYYLAGAPDGPDGAIDVPGHYWRSIGQRFLIGLHLNTGPFGASSWWSSDAPDGKLLFVVFGIIDTWTPEKAERYANRGFVHYHEMITVSDGTPHPTKVVWLKHFAVGSFNFDGGPHPEFGHYVTPGVDYDFMPNYMMPYE